MEKVKYIASYDGETLEERVNKYLEEERMEIVSMQFSTCADKNNAILKAVLLHVAPRKGS